MINISNKLISLAVYTSKDNSSFFLGLDLFPLVSPISVGIDVDIDWDSPNLDPQKDARYYLYLEWLGLNRKTFNLHKYRIYRLNLPKWVGRRLP